ncbi:MAG: hypothetical protein ACRDRS_09240 [Pseudonocardiaceae bacterium]
MSTMSDYSESGRYTLIAFDRHGVLRDDLGAVDRLIEALGREPVTDVFVFSHGWLNNRDQANAHYQNVIRAVAKQYSARRTEIEDRRPGFRPLLVGLHWPSTPWTGLDTLYSLEEEVAFYTSVIGDGSAEDELRPLLEQARTEPDPDRLPGPTAARLLHLDQMSGLRTAEVGAAPGDDREVFEPQRIFRDFKDNRSGIVGSRAFRSVLSPLWVTSFWVMKRRALDVGRTGVHHLLRRLQAPDQTQRVRFHLIGHSFGGIVCCGALQGPRGEEPPLRPVHSLTLLQGALSLWSFAEVIPDTERSGYFRHILRGSRVAGPIVTTQSDHDRALGWFYRMAAPLSRDPRLAPGDTPRYGAVGSYGLAGLSDGLTVWDELGRARWPYRLEPGRCYNIDCTSVINGHRLSLQGSHSDLEKAELADLLWAAVTSA